MSVTTGDGLIGLAVDECKLANEVLARVAEKWSMRVVLFLNPSSARFSDMQRGIAGISQRMLTRTLRGLERDGLVRRTVTPSKPPRVDYELTDLGFSLQDSVRPIGRWSQENCAAVRAAQAAFDSRPKPPPAPDPAASPFDE